MQAEFNSYVPAVEIGKEKSPDKPLSGLTVLVVEDSRFASEAMRLLCLRSGARIRHANCLRAAMRHLKTYRPNIILVDMGLPDGSGAELIARIATPDGQDTAVLGLSGDPDMRESAIAAGARGFITKPIENLAVFQQAILETLSPKLIPRGPRLLPSHTVKPGQDALREDLMHVVKTLKTAEKNNEIDYIARFLAGVARSVHDAPLEAAATALANDHRAGRIIMADLDQISGMVHQRLAQVVNG